MIVGYTHRNGHREEIEIPIAREVLEQIRNDPRLFPRPTDEHPSEEELAEMVLGDELHTATDGCEGLEPDGICPHGHVSWVRYLGIG